MTLVADLADRGINPAESPYDCRLEVDVEEHHAIIVWTEALQFHAEYLRTEYLADEWAPLVNGDGWLTAVALGAIGKRLQGLLDRAGIETRVWPDAHGDDEPSITFEIVTDYFDDDTYEAWLDRIGWPVTTWRNERR